MRSVHFDYPNTCPKIDSAISDAKQQIQRFIDDLLEEASPLLPTHTREELAARNADELYRELEDAFEEVRSSNEDMRREADSQIAALQSEIEDLTAQVKGLEERESES